MSFPQHPLPPRMPATPLTSVDRAFGAQVCRGRQRCEEALASNPASQPRRSGRQRALRPLWQHRPPRKTHVARRRSALPTLAQTTSQGPHRAARPPCTATCRRLACSLASFFRLLCVHSAVCVCASSGCVDAIRARSPAAAARLEFPDHDQTGRYREVLTIVSTLWNLDGPLQANVERRKREGGPPASGPTAQ